MKVSRHLALPLLAVAIGLGVYLSLDLPGAPPHLVVLAGSGHVGPHAMPGRAARRGVAAALTLGPIEGDKEPPPEGAEAVDVLLVLDEDKEKEKEKEK